MEAINEFLSSLDAIQGLSAVALVFCCCIVAGYTLRFIKSFPNEGIPVAVILVGAIAMMVLADPRTSDMPARVWVARNLIVGLVLGFVAWMAHKLVVSRLEDWLSQKSALIAKLLGAKTGDTVIINKQDVTPPTPPKP